MEMSQACIRTNLDARALRFRARLREKRVPGTLKQGSFSLVFARNKEHAYDWLIRIQSLLNALLCERRLLQICEEAKAFYFEKFWLIILMELITEFAVAALLTSGIATIRSIISERSG